MHPHLETFRAACTEVAAQNAGPSEIVRSLAPQMRELLQSAPEFLEPCHRRGRPDRYARNLIFAARDDTLSLFTLVWAPGQWTPIHDHGTWGVVGVVEGMLEEQAFVRADRDAGARRDDGIDLRTSGLVLLPAGAVVTFVPNPDHIHITGVAANREPALSLHLYGRYLNAFHVYDRAAGTRRAVQVEHMQTGML